MSETGKQIATGIEGVGRATASVETAANSISDRISSLSKIAGTIGVGSVLAFAFFYGVYLPNETASREDRREMQREQIKFQAKISDTNERLANSYSSLVEAVRVGREENRTMLERHQEQIQLLKQILNNGREIRDDQRSGVWRDDPKPTSKPASTPGATTGQANITTFPE